MSESHLPRKPSFLKRFYRRLPLVRELNAIRATPPNDRVHQEAFVLQLLSQDRYKGEKRLHHYEHQVFSQNGEDGSIREIFRRIGVQNRTFLEIGVGDGQRNNTTFLLTQGWHGNWIEGDSQHAASIRKAFRVPLEEGRLGLLEKVVTRENVRDAIAGLALTPHPDLLSLDVDRNTYWILADLLQVVQPRVAIIEYNALFPPDVEWKVAYDPQRWWNRTSYYGASLKSYERLCREHGLALVGCDLHGVNAYFVREELCGDHFEGPFTAEHHYEPPRHFLIRTQAYPPSFSDLE